MKSKFLIVLGTILFHAMVSPASANVINITATIDLTTGTFLSPTFLDVANVPVQNFTLASGDSINLGVNFKPGQSVTMLSAPGNTTEVLQALFLPFPTGTAYTTSNILSFSGVTGVVNPNLGGVFPNTNGLASSVFQNFTDSQFSFDGFQLNTTFTNLQGLPNDFVFNGFELRLSSDSGALTVSAVPEVSTWLMMLLGLTGIGFLARRRSQNAFAIVEEKVS